MGKLVDMAKRAEAEAKAARDAVKSGNKEPPVMGTLRQQVDELNSAVQAASSAFNPKNGTFEPGDVKTQVSKSTGGGYDDDSVNPELLKMLEGQDFATTAADTAAPKSKKSSSAKKSTSGGGDYSFLEGTLEKVGKGNKAKKRHFKLGKTTLTYSASAKPTAKVLGIVQLGGAKVKQTGESFVITDSAGRESGA